MRHIARTPVEPPLPLPPPRKIHQRQRVGSFELSGPAIERFNALLHELCPDAPHVDADAIASVARWLHSQPIEQRDRLLRARLSPLVELQAMREDPDWSLEPAQAQRIDKLMTYIAGTDDLIPDDIRALGRLDDALLIELVWPMFADDLDDYRDFCRFREEENGSDVKKLTQKDWLRLRLEEGALWEQLHRVHEQHYVDYGPLTSGFHVS